MYLIVSRKCIIYFRVLYLDHGIEKCNLQECPIDGQWNDWGGWSSCSTTCGHGVKTRTRGCSKPKHRGNECFGKGDQF